MSSFLMEINFYIQNNKKLLLREEKWIKIYLIEEKIVVYAKICRKKVNLKCKTDRPLEIFTMRKVNIIPIGEKTGLSMWGPFPIRSGTSVDCEKIKKSFQKNKNNFQNKIRVDARTKARIGTASPASQLEINGTTSTNKLLLKDTVTLNSPCSANGLVATDVGGVVMSCQAGKWQRQFNVVEENGFVAGCYVTNGYCANIVASYTPPNTVIYTDPHYGMPAYDTTIGPRAFCALGMYTIDAGGGGFCRILAQGIDASNGKPIWHIHVGTSNGKTNVGCHAVCIQ
jgi:hypothetical protein